MGVVRDVAKLHFKLYQNCTRLRGVNACFFVFGTAKVAIFGPFGNQNPQNKLYFTCNSGPNVIGN